LRTCPYRPRSLSGFLFGVILTHRVLRERCVFRLFSPSFWRLYRW
jgi:hypothetical protein